MSEVVPRQLVNAEVVEATPCPTGTLPSQGCAPSPPQGTVLSTCTAVSTLTDVDKLFSEIGSMCEKGDSHHEDIVKKLRQHRRQMMCMGSTIFTLTGFTVVLFFRVEPAIQHVYTTSAKLPALTKVSTGRRLLDDDNQVLEEYTAPKGETQAAFDLVQNGMMSFVYKGDHGSSEHVDITSSMRLMQENDGDTLDEEVEVSARREGGKLHFQAMMACFEDSDDCSVVMPNLNSEASARRLQEDGNFSMVVSPRRLFWDYVEPITQQVISGVIVDQINNRRRRGGCFPRGTTVQAVGFGAIPIQHVRIGTRLIGSQGPSEVMVHGHFDADAVASFWNIVTASNHSVTATGRHYFPLANGRHEAAENLKIGDELMVEGGGGLEKSKVISVSSTEAVGLYNPYTTSGDLLVNGILASSHSDWFLEEAGLTASTIVTTYRALFKPLTWLHAVKPEAFHCFHKMVVDEFPAYNLATVPASFIFSSALQSILLGCPEVMQPGEIV